MKVMIHSKTKVFTSSLLSASREHGYRMLDADVFYDDEKNYAYNYARLISLLPLMAKNVIVYTSKLIGDQIHDTDKLSAEERRELRESLIGRMLK